MFYKTVLVVTDKFPPSISGGAEISLHNMLDAMNHNDKRVVIAALSPGRYELKKEFYQNRVVYRVPFNESWPISMVGAGMVRKMYRILKFFIANFKKNNFRSVYRVFLAGVVRVGWKKHFGSLPLIDVDYLKNSRTIDFIRDIVSEEDPDLIHADNYRSIVLANSLDLDIPVLSYVRDNRFFCAHKNQATNINGVICVNCDFGCVSGKFPSIIENKVVGLMRETLDVRQTALSKSSTVAVTSEYLNKQIRSVLFDNNVIKVPNLIEDFSEIAEIQASIKQSSVPEILCVGMIGHNKGQMLLIKMMSALSSKVGDFKVVLAGVGQMSAKLAELARKQGVLDKLHITGFLSRKELYRCYARSACVVCPTVWPEPFGRVPFEAAASSKPIVAFSVGGLSENIIHEVTGLLVEPRNMQGFSDAIARIILDPPYAKFLGDEGYKYIKNKFIEQNSPEVLLKEWERLCEDS